MLYISRCVHTGVPSEQFSIPKKLLPEHIGVNFEEVYGVVDTDDDVEELVTRSELLDICCNRGVVIEGVIVARDYIRCVSPYQLESSISRAQRRAEVVCNVTVTRYKDEVTEIFWDSFKLQKPVSIRLSNFGSSCGSQLFNRRLCIGRLAPHGHHMLTIILDGKITFTDKSFFVVPNHWGGLGREGFGLVFDIRELTDEKLAEIIYFSVAMSGAVIETGIVDSEDRMKAMKAKLVQTEWYSYW